MRRIKIRACSDNQRKNRKTFLTTHYLYITHMNTFCFFKKLDLHYVLNVLFNTGIVSIIVAQMRF